MEGGGVCLLNIYTAVHTFDLLFVAVLFVVSFVLITFSLRLFSTKWASLGPEASQFKERSGCL